MRCSLFLAGLSFVALRSRIVRLTTGCAPLRCLIFREFARDHRDDTAVHWVDHQEFVLKLDEVVLLEDWLLVDERRGHRVELELRGDLGANLGLKVVRGLLGAVRSYERVLNFATLLIAELQWRLGLSGSGEFVWLNWRICILRRRGHGED